MHTTLNVKVILTTIGGLLGGWLGGMDGLLYALMSFVVLDYVTGVLCAIDERSLSSSIGFHGIAKKCMIFILVIVANTMDLYVLGRPGVVRGIVVFFYLTNEGISILENAKKLGLPIPKKLEELLH